MIPGKKRNRRSPTDEAAAVNPPEGESKLSRNITRTLIALLCIGLGMWALLASLIAWHSHNRYKYSRIDLQDQRDVYNEYKAETRSDLEFFRRELTEAEILREQASQLVQQMVVEDKKPARLNDIFDTIAKIHGQLTRESLDQADIAYMEDLLKELLAAKNPKPKPKPPPPAATSIAGNQKELDHLLKIMAEQNLLRTNDLTTVSAQLQKIIEEQKTPQPLIKPPPPATKKKQVVETVPAPKPPPEPKGPQPQPYKNTAMKFSTIFPAEWTIKDKEIANGVLAVSPRSAPRVSDAGYATLIATELPDGQDLEAFFHSHTNDSVQVTSGYELLIAGDMEVDKTPAKYARYKHDKVGKKFETLKIVTVRGNFAYVMSFSAADAIYETRHERNFARIVLSFKFL